MATSKPEAQATADVQTAMEEVLAAERAALDAIAASQRRADELVQAARARARRIAERARRRVAALEGAHVANVADAVDPQSGAQPSAALDLPDQARDRLAAALARLGDRLLEADDAGA